MVFEAICKRLYFPDVKDGVREEVFSFLLPFFHSILFLSLLFLYLLFFSSGSYAVLLEKFKFHPY